jgi:hypothetical protein
MENSLVLGGFVVLLISLGLMFVSGYRMLDVINKDRTSQEKIPRWHLFVRLYSNDLINTYRNSHRGEPLNKLFGLAWILFGIGFLMIICSHYATY